MIGSAVTPILKTQRRTPIFSLKHVILSLQCSKIRPHVGDPDLWRMQRFEKPSGRCPLRRSYFVSLDVSKDPPNPYRNFRFRNTSIENNQRHQTKVPQSLLYFQLRYFLDVDHLVSWRTRLGTLGCGTLNHVELVRLIIKPFGFQWSTFFWRRCNLQTPQFNIYIKQCYSKHGKYVFDTIMSIQID